MLLTWLILSLIRWSHLDRWPKGCLSYGVNVRRFCWENVLASGFRRRLCVALIKYSAGGNFGQQSGVCFSHNIF